jgi:transmembrane sensor
MNDKEDSVHEMNPRFTRRASVHELIAEEAADWFVANREGLDATQSAAFAAWLKASPRNIEEYLNITLIGRDLRTASADPTVSVEDLIKGALGKEDPVVLATPPEPPRSLGRNSRASARLHSRPQPAVWAAAMAAVGALALAFLFWKNTSTRSAEDGIAYHIQTRHGEQLTRQLPDNSVVKLDTDTEVSVRFDRTQRVVRVISGRAEFKVAHEPQRKFLVQAGTLGITDVGTVFDVFAGANSTVVTVLEGRVAVALDTNMASLRSKRPGVAVEPQKGAASPIYATVEVAAGQEVRVDDDSWPPTYTRVDPQRATAWLRRQIVFENEPLERVAAEFNRYAATPIEIDSAELRTLAVSGVFAADDTESFIDFLRSLDGVHVEVTPARIRVSRK